MCSRIVLQSSTRKNRNSKSEWIYEPGGISWHLFHALNFIVLDSVGNSSLISWQSAFRPVSLPLPPFVSPARASSYPSALPLSRTSNN